MTDNRLAAQQSKNSSKDRQRMQRRSRAKFDSQRRSRKQELATIQAPSLFGGSFEVEIIENAYAHRNQRQLIADSD